MKVEIKEKINIVMCAKKMRAETPFSCQCQAVSFSGFIRDIGTGWNSLRFTKVKLYNKKIIQPSYSEGIKLKHSHMGHACNSQRVVSA